MPRCKKDCVSSPGKVKVSEMQSEFLKSYSLIGESDVGIMVIK